MGSDTIFEKIIRKEIPAAIVYEDEHVLAFKDINPQAPIHVLVIPKEKMVSFCDIKDRSTEKMGHFMKGISRAAAELGLEDNGYRIIFNTGSDGQQTVPYIHAHIYGGRQMNWPAG
tara:strand:- start:194 stop:541 length:348 start_codon:yes stop_codon:yes gene_type:complete